MSESITISFVGTTKQKAWLEAQAQADDRSVSYILRQILEREAQRQQSQSGVRKPVMQKAR